MVVSTTFSKLFTLTESIASRSEICASRSLPLFAMAKKEDGLRKLVGNLVDQGGATQRELADSMGVSESWLSRWLHGEKTRGMTLEAEERFKAFLNKRTKLYVETQRETIESSSSAGSAFSEADTSSRRSGGRGRS